MVEMVIRVLAALALIALFVADYGVAAMAKPVPEWVYYLLGALVFGVSPQTVRGMIQSALARALGTTLDREDER